MDRVTRFFELLPLWEEIIDLSTAATMFAAMRAGDYEMEGDADKPLRGSALFTFRRGNTDLNFQDVVRLLEAAANQAISQGGPADSLERIVDAAKQIPRTRVKSKLHSIEGVIIEQTSNVEAYVHKMAEEAFGVWGSHFFSVAWQYEHAAPTIFSRRPTKTLLPDSGNDMPSDPLHALTLRKSDVTLGEYCVLIAGCKAPCLIKAKTEFELFRVLWEHAGNFVRFDQIVDELEEGDTLDTSVLPSRKMRLIRTLEKNPKYRDLAQCILSTTNAYGLFFRSESEPY